VSHSDISVKLGCILLAAGGSRRLGRPKQTVEFEGESIVGRAARNLISLDIGPVVVVSGSGHHKVSKLLKKYEIDTVLNESWEQGIGSSITVGMHRLPADVSGVLIALCDQWMLKSQDFKALLHQWHCDISAITVSCWGNREDGYFGPPVIFPRRLFSELKQLEGDLGARAIIQKYIQHVTFVEMKNAAQDLDEPSDLEELRKYSEISSS